MGTLHPCVDLGADPPLPPLLLELGVLPSKRVSLLLLGKHSHLSHEVAALILVKLLGQGHFASEFVGE